MLSARRRVVSGRSKPISVASIFLTSGVRIVSPAVFNVSGGQTRAPGGFIELYRRGRRVGAISPRAITYGTTTVVYDKNEKTDNGPRDEFEGDKIHTYNENVSAMRHTRVGIVIVGFK